jgi:hypothetical protein
MDLTGDGLPDVVVERSDRFTWFASKGKGGFAQAADIPKPAASPGASLPRMGEDQELDFAFADMNGDGLPDLVRIRNGRVEYWPQIGHGRFGAGVLMEDSPVIDSEEEFDIARVQLVDLDGSGTADLLYIGRGEIRVWTNAGGNRLVERAGDRLSRRRHAVPGVVVAAGRPGDIDALSAARRGEPPAAAALCAQRHGP